MGIWERVSGWITKITQQVISRDNLPTCLESSGFLINSLIQLTHVENVPDTSEQSNNTHQPDGEAWPPASETRSALKEWQDSSSKMEELRRTPWGSDMSAEPQRTNRNGQEGRIGSNGGSSCLRQERVDQGAEQEESKYGQGERSRRWGRSGRRRIPNSVTKLMATARTRSVIIQSAE